jgi:hypothetical protein
MESKTFQDYTSLTNQDRIRQELLYWMKALPYWSIVTLSEAICINHITLRRFLGGKKVLFNQLAKIENWIEEQKRINKEG